MSTLNAKYSYKSFTNQDLSALPASEFNNTTIKGAGFFQLFNAGETIPSSGGKSIFPEGITGVTFLYCNLDNVSIPAGNVIIEGTNKTIQIQNDREFWTLHKVNGVWTPEKPLDFDKYVELGVSTNPDDIPSSELQESIIITEEKKLGV